jgi:2,5-diamino-6-(ribosylamino)-4(3H)-pyrimidinone 5'-phosphate reductase
MSPYPSRKFTGTLITALPDELPSEKDVLKLFPEPVASLAVEDVYSNISFPKREKRPYVIINMVCSLDGKVVHEGKASQIGSSTDRAVMRTLRAHADAVMVGAGTLRAEKLRLDVPEDLSRERESRGLKPQPLAVIASTSGDVPLEKNLLGSSPDNLLILVTPTVPQSRLAALSRVASVEIMPDETGDLHLDPTDALKVLKKRHAVDVLLIEGGPTFNHALISSGLADELFFTLAPILLGGEKPEALNILEGRPLIQKTEQPELISIHLSGNELFLRYFLCSTG